MKTYYGLIAFLMMSNTQAAIITFTNQSNDLIAANIKYYGKKSQKTINLAPLTLNHIKATSCVEEVTFIKMPYKILGGFRFVNDKNNCPTSFTINAKWRVSREGGQLLPFAATPDIKKKFPQTPKSTIMQNVSHK